MSRVDDVPVYEQRDDTVDARLYNRWRRAKRRFKMPFRMEFEELPGVALILDKDEWACVDTLQNDLPLLAWVAFEDQGRDALHTAVACKLNYYHFAASKYRARVLQLMAEELERRLRLS